MRGSDVRGQRLPLGRLGDVEMAVLDRRAEPGGQRLALAVEHVGGDHDGTLGGERLGLGGALPAGGAGDDDDLAGAPVTHPVSQWFRLRSDSSAAR